MSMGSVFVSVCRWCVFVSSVHPDIVQSGEFCIVCSLFMFVFDMMGGTRLCWHMTSLSYDRIFCLESQKIDCTYQRYNHYFKSLFLT